jgi:hypothetical protein
MDAWQKVWRDGFAPVLSTAALNTLRHALETDDPRLLQGVTTVPPPLQCVGAWAVEGACALGYCGWQGDGLQTVAQVERYFARACRHADQRLGDSGACRFFLNWFDNAPREQMRRQLLAEVDRELKRRPAQRSAA